MRSGAIEQEGILQCLSSLFRLLVREPHPDRNSVSVEEKAAIIKGVSEVLLNILNKPLETSYVVIEEVDLDSWGWGGLPTVQYRKLRSARGKVLNSPTGTPAVPPAIAGADFCPECLTTAKNETVSRHEAGNSTSRLSRSGVRARGRSEL